MKKRVEKWVIYRHIEIDRRKQYLYGLTADQTSTNTHLHPALLFDTEEKAEECIKKIPGVFEWHTQKVWVYIVKEDSHFEVWWNMKIKFLLELAFTGLTSILMVYGAFAFIHTLFN